MKKFKTIGSPYNKDLQEVTLPSGVRYYQTPEGNRYPSVTTILSLHSKEKLEAWKKKVGETEAAFQSKRAATRGTLLHELMEKYLKGENVSDLVFNYPMGVVSLFQGMQVIVDLHLDNIHCQEVPLYSDTLKAAGRTDCIAEWDHDLAVIDFKGSNHEKNESWIDNYFMQCSAYAFMYWQQTGLMIKKIVVLIGSETGGAQLFVKNPMNYIRAFKDLSVRYHKENEICQHTK